MWRVQINTKEDFTAETRRRERTDKTAASFKIAEIVEIENHLETGEPLEMDEPRNGSAFQITRDHPIQNPPRLRASAVNKDF